MDDTTTKKLDALVKQRFEATASKRKETRLAVLKREPLSAEPDRSRAGNFASHMGAESIQGDTIDYVPSSFLPIGSKRSQAVGIVRTGTGSALGTGFLISPDLLITNNHVLETPEQAATSLIEFNFETDEQGLNTTGTRFSLDPKKFWLMNPIDGFDFSIIAVGERLSGKDDLASFGYLPLSDRPDKHALGMAVNIVEHPQGRRKQVVVRENRLLARGNSEHCLHYSADTEEGASGSPVFNDAWEVVALHHWGVPHLDTMTVDGTPIPVTVNEGIRASIIVGQLRVDVDSLSPTMQNLLKTALNLGESLNVPTAAPNVPGKPQVNPHALPLGGEAIPEPSTGEPMAPTSTATTQIVMVPLEVTVRVAQVAPVTTPLPLTPPKRTLPSGLEYAERARIDRNYADRNGYNPEFIDGLSVKLPDLVNPRIGEVTPLVDGSTGAKAVLNYQNFSVVMCGPRRMAFVSAANIDAGTYVNIDRDTGEPAVGPEGDSWYDDTRMDPAHYLGQAFYGGWSAYFDRGHLTRRSDPTWGTNEEAARANTDTFHRTNCTPQHFRFNESIKFWQGLERYILEFGVLKAKAKVTVLTGPVLDTDNTSKCDDVEVPLLFWKVVLRVGPDAKPQASAFIVSQEKLLEETRVSLKPPADDQVPTVTSFRTSVEHLAELTGLAFDAFALYDTFKKPRGAEAAALKPVTDWTDAL